MQKKFQKKIDAWFRMAEVDLEAAEADFQAGRHPSCVYHAQQCCETEIQDLWVTPAEFHGLLAGRTGWLMDALHEGRVIYEREGFLSRAIEQFRLLVGREFVRQGRTWRFL